MTTCPTACGRCRLCWLAANDPRYSEPGFLKKAANLALAAARHVADGLAAATEEEKAARLRACAGCPLLTDRRTCAHPDCGCYVDVKAGWRSERCPLGMWPGEGPAAGPPAEKKGCGCGATAG